MRKFVFALALVVFFNFCSRENPREIRAPGIVDGEVITLKSLVAGQVQKTEGKEGEKAEKNAVLVEINPDKIENQLKNLDIGSGEIKINETKLKKRREFLQSTVQYLSDQVQRFKRLKEKNSVSGEKLENMELKLLEARTSEYDIQKSLDMLAVKSQKIENQREYLQLLMQDHQLKSPVSGIIMESFVSPGENVFPGSPLMDILDISSLYVEIFIEEPELAALEIGQRARILVDGMEKTDLSGAISFFGKKAEFSPKYVISEKERKSLLYQVKISIDRDQSLFKIGMPVTVVLEKKKRNWFLMKNPVR